MGTCGVKKASRPQLVSRQIISTNRFKGTTFNYSSSTLEQISTQAVIIFVDSHYLIHNKLPLKKGNIKISEQLQQYINAELETHKNAEILFFNNEIPVLSFKEILVFPIEIWNKQTKSEQYCQKLFKKMFQFCKDHSIGTICINQTFCSLGYPINAVAKAFYNALLDIQIQLEKIVIVSTNENLQNIYIKNLRQIEKGEMSTYDDNASRQQSVYF